MDSAFAPLAAGNGGTDGEAFQCQAAPDDAPAPPGRHARLGKPSSRWAYRDPGGLLLGFVYRFDRTEGLKEFRPIFWGKWRGTTGWHWKAPEAPRPLYGLQALYERPDALVVVTEGEKAADGAAAHFPDLVAVSPINGAKSPAKADWSPIAGRPVVIWGDHDEPGAGFVEEVAALCHDAGAVSIHIVAVPDHFPIKWDLADAAPEDRTAEDLRGLIDAARPWKPAVQIPPDVETQGAFKLARVTKPGVYRAMEDDDHDKVWIRFCSPLEILADTRDADNQSWGRLLRVTDRDGVNHDWPMPMAMLAGDGADYRRQLLSLGLELEPGRATREALQSYITVWRPSSKARCVDRLGWSRRTFVLPDVTFGETGGEPVLLQTVHGAPRYALAGSLDGWRHDVARLAVGNSRLAFGIAAGFAGPLLDIMAEESGGFHFRGGSSIGKTTILRAAVSVWGCDLGGWRTTDNAAEGLARNSADALLCLDEIGQADGKAVEALAYMLGNERGKARMKRDGINRPPITWRVLFLSTGEIGLADKLVESGRRTRAGQEVRVVEIPADAGHDLGVFEKLHGFTDGDQLARHLKQAAEQNKGYAARQFLERLVADLDKAGDAVSVLRKRWLAAHLPAEAEGQVHRVAGRFGLVAAAGELATTMDVLPWDAGEAARAAACCFAAWLASRGGHGPLELREGLHQVRLFLERHGSSRFEEIEPGDDKGRPPINRAGFRRKHGNKWEYLVMPEVWRKEICQGFDAAMLAKAMIERRWMVGGEGKNLAKKEKLPGIGPKRVYVVKTDFLASDGEP